MDAQQQQQQMSDDYYQQQQQPTIGADIVLDVALRTLFDFIQRAMAAPMDRVMLLTTIEGELICQGRLPSEGFGGVWGCVQFIWRKEGVMGFFRGLGTDFALSLPSGLVDTLSVNAVFAVLQAALPAEIANSLSYAQVMIISTLATVASSIVALPYNALRKSIVTNYMGDIVGPIAANNGDGNNSRKDGSGGAVMAEGYRYASATEAARSILRRTGWRGFYRGALVDPALLVAYRSVYILSAAVIPPQLQEMYPGAVMRGMVSAAELTTQPLEVISRRLILTALEDSSSSSGNEGYTGPLDCAEKVVAKGGVTALWSGFAFRVMSSCLVMTAQYAFYLAMN